MASDQDQDFYLFGDMGQTPNAFASQTYDAFLDTSVSAQDNEFLDVDMDVVKKEYAASPGVDPVFTRASTSSASSNSSSASLHRHNRIPSTATTTSPVTSKNEWGTGINGMSISEPYYENDSDLDQQMQSAFDFDTAASTPSGFDAASIQTARPLNPQVRRNVNVNMMAMNSMRNSSPRMTTAAPASFFLGSREASPLSSMLPTSQAPSPWTKPSPSSGLEETFHHMGMNGDSPGNATFSPNMHMNFADTQFQFAGDSSGTPSSFAKDVSSPPSTIHSVDGQPALHIHPTSLKSRVETQIPIKMALTPMPNGIKKLRLPTHTVSKPKFLAKPDTDRSPDTLELSVMLVCTSAMQDPHRKQRALARARGEDLPPYSRPSPASSTGSTSSRDDEEKPLNGGEVKICSGCIQRERKRASRKKQKKPEEEELFQKDEERRVVVFNTNEVKEWIEPTLDQSSMNSSPLPPPGTRQVELPMRIACYCRHQNEKLGFQVIFTIKDFRDRLIAQAMTNSIMITDDHKTHNTPQSLSTSQNPQIPPAQLPGAGVFSTGGIEAPLAEHPGSKLFKQSYSTPDLTRLQQGFGGQFMSPGNAPFAIPQAQTMSGNTSATLTPRNLSRPASPSGPSGPATKRRKPSGSGKLPSGLTMTRLDTVQPQIVGSATMPNTAASSPYAPNMPAFMAGNDRQMQSNMHPRPFGNSPPTPGGDGTFSGAINRSFSLENLPRQALMSAPSSRHPSRPGSPLATHHNGFGSNDANFPQAVNAQLMNQSSRRPQPVIHKLVPGEGSVSGGTEVTLLGNGFYQGLEVMFGDTEATTTTFWGEKCLNCIAPPAVQAGMVAVVFKHEHPHYSAVQPTSHVRHSVFTYVDDREIETLRLALRTIGKQMGTDDPYTAAQQLLQQNQNNGGGVFPQQGNYGMTNGHQMHASGPMSQAFAPQEMESCLLRMLHLARQQVGSAPIQLDLRRPTGLSLLHLASSLNMSKFVLALLRAGADANMLDNNGFTPMHHAAMNGHEQVICHLRLGGADHRLRSIRNFVPADLATTLRTYQATMRPFSHSRAQSGGISTLDQSSRNESSQSLVSFDDSSSLSQTESESETVDDTIAVPAADVRRMPFAQPMPRSAQPSRRASRQDFPISQAVVKPVQEQEASPSTLVNAWRQLVNMTQAQQTQLAEQLHHLQDTMPALPNIQLPDYQNNGMVRRMSALFPQRQASEKPNEIKALPPTSDAASTAPPSYEELFPTASNNFSEDKKDVSAMHAAAEAAIDRHFEEQETSNVKAPVQSEASSSAAPERISLMQDRKLFFFWVSICPRVSRCHTNCL